MNRPKLGDLLVEANLIDEVQMRVALEEQKRHGTKFGSTLLALNFVDENVLSAFLSKQLDIPCVSLTNIEIPGKVLSKVPRALAVKHHAIPVRFEQEKLYVAMSDPMDMDAAEELEKVTGMVVVPMIAPQSSIEQVLKRYYPEEGRAREEKVESAAALFPEMMREINELDLFGRYFNQINERLEQIEARLRSIESLLGSRGAGSPDP
jgi:type IV pilus assembly protein PilB